VGQKSLIDGLVELVQGLEGGGSGVGHGSRSGVYLQLIRY
jgi:hypothetical protein